MPAKKKAKTTSSSSTTSPSPRKKRITRSSNRDTIDDNDTTTTTPKLLSSPSSSTTTTKTTTTTTTTTTTKKSKKLIKSASSSSKTTSPQIAVQVHRFRHANYIPNGILKLCATPHPTTTNTNSHNHLNYDNTIVPHLAISREGGSVELVSVDENWKCVAIVEGMKKRNVDAMVWVCGRKESFTTAIATANNNNEDMNKNNNNDDYDEDHSMTNHNNNQYICHNHKVNEEIQTKRRLFGSSRDGTIFEIDFKTKTHIGVIGSGGGAVFCLASLCPRCNCCSSQRIGGDDAGSRFKCCHLLAAGCEDGSVRIFRVLDRHANNSNTSLELVSTLPSVGSAVTSIAWLPPPSLLSSNSNGQLSTTGLEGSVLYAGVADGTIRKFTLTSMMQSIRERGSAPHAISTGMLLTSSGDDGNTRLTSTDGGSLAGLQWKSNARLTVENRGERVATKIWSLQALDNGTLISGDSMGNVQFWDGNAGTLLQTFEHNPNNADVLDIAVSLNQKKVLASGVDSRVICIEFDESSTTASSKWVMTNQQRFHTHDVNSLALVYRTDPSGCAGANTKASSKKAVKAYTELLCSGGVDTKVCSYFVSDMRRYRPRIVYKYPSKAPITLSKIPRILSIMRSDSIDFYQLGDKRPPPTLRSSGVALDEDRAYLGSVRIASNHNLMAFDMSDDGTLLAVSHAAGLHLFSLEFVDSYANDDGETIRKIVRPTKIDVPLAINAACSCLKFSRNKLILANCNGTINIVAINKDLVNKSYSIAIEQSIHHRDIQSHFSNHYPITHLDVSADGHWLATARNTLGKGSVNVLALTPSFKHWWTIPCTEAPFSCMKWLYSGKNETALVVAMNNGAFYIFDAEHRRLSEWSQDLGFPASPNLPREISYCLDRPDRLASNSATPDKFLMVSNNFVYKQTQ